MKKINKLSKTVINKIAAGEVIERPASVVKELIENSIDAGANNIEVRVKNGGLGSILIKDDGEGMSEDDLQLCLEKHATSKIKEIEDIDNIKTLGFRGEAIPSIASVSRFKIDTITKKDSIGNYIKVEGGKIIEKGKTNLNNGTKVEVSSLYYNIPARRRFIKSERTENYYINQAFLDIALSFPNISFLLQSNNNLVYNLPAVKNLKNRLNTIIKDNFTNNLLSVNYEKSNLKIKGYIGKPEIAKRRNNLQKIIVNGRGITNKAINFAINDGYRNFLFGKEKAVYFIYIDIDPEEIDVNIHPRKSEIRFENGQELFSIFRKLIKKTLEKELQVNKIFTIKKNIYNVKEQKEENYLSDKKVVWNNNENRNEKNIFKEKNFNIDLNKKEQIITNNKNKPIFSSNTLTSLGQIVKTYIMAKVDEGLILVDQHAIVERKLFEQLRKDILKEKKNILTQVLLIPIGLEITKEEVKILKKKSTFLKKFGYEISEIAPDQYVIVEVPAIFNERTKHQVDHEKIIIEILNNIKDKEKINKEEEESIRIKQIEKIIARMACLGAIKAGDVLSMEEQNLILSYINESDYKDQNKGNFAGYCPHGRPVVKILNKKDLEKIFKR